MKVGVSNLRGGRLLFDVKEVAKDIGFRKQLIRGDFENIGELAQDQQRRIARASLDLTDVRAIHLGHERELLLGKVFNASHQADVFRQLQTKLFVVLSHARKLRLEGLSIHGI